MATTKAERLNKIHADALLEFDKIQAAVKDERLQCLSDRRFYSIAGAQWEGALGDQFENKPKFEVNKIHLAVIRIINEYRNNKVSVVFEAPDDEDQDFAEKCTGIHRSNEKDSCADEAYDNAFEEAVGGGFGAWRLRADYEDDSDEENDKQVIVIEPIYDADCCVFFDADAKRQDKSDAKSAFILSSISRSAYEEEWDDDPASWPKEITNTEFDWSKDDSIFIAEYYKVEHKKETIIYFQGLTEDIIKLKESEITEEKQHELEVTGYHETRRKKIKTKKVRKYIMSGGGILEDCGLIAGKNIPIVPVYGKRWFVDNVERCMGHVRLPKDVQRLKNMQLSKLGELSALSSVEKPIFLAEQIKGFEEEWAADAVENYAYLRINAIRDANGNPIQTQPIGYTKAPSIPPAMAALLQITEQDIQDLLGNQQAGEQLQPNTSGLAVELVQNKLDMQSFIYLSNFGKGMKRSGEIWFSMAKDLFVEDGRKMLSIDEQGNKENIPLMQKIADKDGNISSGNNFTNSNFKVTASIGPSSDSKRRSTVRALTGMMAITQDPETLQVLGSMCMMNMEGEGIADVRNFFRAKLVKMGAIKPTKQEADQLAQEQTNAKPDANSEYLQAAAAEALAKAENEKADKQLTLAKTEKTQVETQKIQQDSHLGVKQHNLEVAKVLQGAMSQPTS